MSAPLAIALLSGGLDSTTAAALALEAGHRAGHAEARGDLLELQTSEHRLGPDLPDRSLIYGKGA